MINGFLALISTEPNAQIRALAAACTIDLDRFRAPQTTADYERRRPERLSSRQQDLLRTWGYPYVLEEFRWHMTLTDRVDERLAGSILPHLEQAYRCACENEPGVVDGLSLLHQPKPDTPFRLVARVPLGTSELQNSP